MRKQLFELLPLHNEEHMHASTYCLSENALAEDGTAYSSGLSIDPSTGIILRVDHRCAVHKVEEPQDGTSLKLQRYPHRFPASGTSHRQHLPIKLQ